MKTDKLQEKTVVELHELAAKKGIPGHHAMNKDELVSHLADDSESNDKPIHAKGEHFDGDEGEEEKRQFETSPGKKEMLTKAEAEKKKFFWKEDKPAAK